MTGTLRIRSWAAALALGVCGVCAWTSTAQGADGQATSAQDTSPSAAPPAAAPGADQIQFAAREHDLGYRAYVEKQYDEAASHFENAFFAAPNPAELRSAIRARRDAGELARAATLAAIGQSRFPSDPATTKAAADAIGQARPHVYEVQISSGAEFSVAVDEKIMATDRVRESRVFVNPGAHELVVSWSDERNQRVAIDATEGGSESLHLEPPTAATPPSSGAQSAPIAASSDAPIGVGAWRPPKPFGPPVFVTGAALTAVGLGLTVWSGVDTLNNPGRARVASACQGQSDQCSEYQTGLKHQFRTNVILGITAGLAVATTVVAVFFTQWTPARATTVRTIEPVVGLGQAGVAGTF